MSGLEWGALGQISCYQVNIDMGRFRGWEDVYEETIHHQYGTPRKAGGVKNSLDIQLPNKFYYWENSIRVM